MLVLVDDANGGRPAEQRNANFKQIISRRLAASSGRLTVAEIPSLIWIVIDARHPRRGLPRRPLNAVERNYSPSLKCTRWQPNLGALFAPLPAHIRAAAMNNANARAGRPEYQLLLFIQIARDQTPPAALIIILVGGRPS